MKHILNNLSNEEKNSIREQHTGGMKVVTENFHKLLGSKLGDVKPLVSEQVLSGLSSGNSQNGVKMVFDSCKNSLHLLFVFDVVYPLPCMKSWNTTTLTRSV